MAERGEARRDGGLSCSWARAGNGEQTAKSETHQKNRRPPESGSSAAALALLPGGVRIARFCRILAADMQEQLWRLLPAPPFYCLALPAL